MSFERMNDPSQSESLDEAADWSPKVEALAEQLRDDARMLALRFPAPDGRNVGRFEAVIAATLCGDAPVRRIENCPEHDSQQVTRASVPENAVVSAASRQWTIVLGASAVTLLAALAVWQTAREQGDGGDQSPTTAARRPKPEQIAQIDTLNVSGDSADASRHAKNLLRGLSSAEQEAVLDLLEFGPEAITSLSI